MRKNVIVCLLFVACLVSNAFGQSDFLMKNSLKIGADLAYNEFPSPLISYERLLGKRVSAQIGAWGAFGLVNSDVAKSTKSYRFIAGIKYYIRMNPAKAMSGFYFMPLIRRTASQAKCLNFPKPCFEARRLDFGLGFGYQQVLWKRFQVDAILAPCIINHEIRQSYDSNGFLDSQFKLSQHPSLYMSISAGFLF